MALKVDYLVRETAINLVRNISLTIASVLTVFVSLSLVGSSLLIQDAVDNATERWKGGIEFIIFVSPEASADQRDAIQRALDDSPQVESASFVDQEAAFEEFTELFADTPEIVESTDPTTVPTSFRVVPLDKEPETIETLKTAFEAQPGVMEVVAATDSIRTIQDMSALFRNIALAVAALLVVAACLLVINSIRMAMFARRREIEVMKLVGASNSFVRIPFMLEGVIQGLVGAAAAVPVCFGVRWGLTELAADQRFRLLAGFTVGDGQFRLTIVLILIIGSFIGALGSAFAVSRFLDV